jgi:hypothetical protein
MAISDSMTPNTQQLAEYIQKYGPIPTVSFRPGHDRLWGLDWHYWVSARYAITLVHGRPTLVPTGPTRYWVSQKHAQKDAAELAAKENRIPFFYPPGPVEEEACGLVLRKLEARLSRRD